MKKDIGREIREELKEQENGYDKFLQCLMLYLIQSEEKENEILIYQIVDEHF